MAGTNDLIVNGVAPDKLYVGGTEVEKVYLGTELVYEVIACTLNFDGTVLGSTPTTTFVEPFNIEFIDVIVNTTNNFNFMNALSGYKILRVGNDMQVSNSSDTITYINAFVDAGMGDSLPHDVSIECDTGNVELFIDNISYGIQALPYISTSTGYDIGVDLQGSIAEVHFPELTWKLNSGRTDGEYSEEHVGNPTYQMTYTNVVEEDWTCYGLLQAGAPHVFTLETTTADKSITIPFVDGVRLNVEIDWGDGTVTTVVNYNDVGATHTLATIGTHTITITGIISRLDWYNSADKTLVTEVVRLGECGWTDLSNGWRDCNLTSFYAEFEDSKGVTSFTYFLYNCSGLTTVSPFDTSSGTNFTVFLGNCSGLMTVPLFDTSSGTNFTNFLYGCSGLETVPPFDTSSGANFTYFLRNCSGLETVPLFDTSSGTNFTNFLLNCTGLKTVPSFNTSSGLDFSYFLRNCASLTTVPLFDTSSGTNFTYFLRDCASLRTVSSFNTSSGLDFSYFLYNCASLETVPSFVTSSGLDFSYFLYRCSGLTTVPSFDTSSGTIFTAFLGTCTGLTTVPPFDTSSGINFTNFLYNCSGLTTVPLFVTSSGTNFTYFLRECASLTTVPLFDTSSGLDFSYFLSTCANVTCHEGIDTRNYTNTTDMYVGCTSLVQPSAAEITTIKAGALWSTTCP